MNITQAVLEEGISKTTGYEFSEAQLMEAVKVWNKEYRTKKCFGTVSSPDIPVKEKLSDTDITHEVKNVYYEKGRVLAKIEFLIEPKSEASNYMLVPIISGLIEKHAITGLNIVRVDVKNNGR